MLAVEEQLETIEEQDEMFVEEMPTFNHSFICGRIMRQLMQNQEIETLPELTLSIGNGLTPDICVYPAEQIQPDFLEDITRFEIPPQLAIEVVSPSQTVTALLAKAKTLRNGGVQTVWTVEPMSRTIFVSDKNGTQIIHNGKVESDNIAVDFARIFNNWFFKLDSLPIEAANSNLIWIVAS